MAIISDDDDILQILSSGDFSVAALTDTKVILVKHINNQCSIVREYSLNEASDKSAESYVINHETVIKSTGKDRFKIGRLGIFLGTMPSTPSDPIGDYLNFGVFDGQKDRFVKLRNFKAKNGFFGFGQHPARARIIGNDPIVWGSIKNQFFTAILTPTAKADGFVASPAQINDFSTCPPTPNEGISAAMLFNIQQRGFIRSGYKADQLLRLKEYDCPCSCSLIQCPVCRHIDNRACRSTKLLR